MRVSRLRFRRSGPLRTLPLSREAGAQTPGEPVRPFLRVGSENAHLVPSRACRPSRGRRARLRWRASPRARRGFSETALCDSLAGTRERAGPQRGPPAPAMGRERSLSMLLLDEGRCRASTDRVPAHTSCSSIAGTSASRGLAAAYASEGQRGERSSGLSGGCPVSSKALLPIPAGRHRTSFPRSRPEVARPRRLALIAGVVGEHHFTTR